MTQDDLNRLQRKIVDGEVLTSHEALDLIIDLREARIELHNVTTQLAGFTEAVKRLAHL